MARAALKWSTQDLAKIAGVGANTVNRFEDGQDSRVSSVDKIRAAFESAGIEFLNDERGDGVIKLRDRYAKTPSKADAIGGNA